tara:strand:- start:4544 stop:5278 length:735 start_codon:yes stop_codon:yes gene_type:complete
MGKFKLPGKLPSSPNRIVMPAIQSGGSYRNPAMIIDRSAEILGAGVQAGMDKIGNALKQKAMDKMAEEKGQEPKSNLDKEIQKEKLESTSIDASTKLEAFQPTSIPALDSQAEEFLRNFTPGVLADRNAAPAMIDNELAAVGAPVNLPETPLDMNEKSPLGFVPGQQMGQPQAFSYDVPAQANMMGTAQPVFNQQTMGMAEAAFGNPTMRQASVGAAFQMSKAQEEAFGPGGHSENPGLYKQLK